MVPIVLSVISAIAGVTVAALRVVQRGTEVGQTTEKAAEGLPLRGADVFYLTLYHKGGGGEVDIERDADRGVGFHKAITIVGECNTANRIHVLVKF